MVDAADGALGVGQQHTHPARTLGFGGGATEAGGERGMRVARLFKATKAAQTVALDLAFRFQTALDPVLHRVVVEGPHRLDHRDGGMFEVLVPRHRDDERPLVFRAAARLAAAELAT